MQPVTNDATTALLRAVRAQFQAGQTLRFEEIRSRSWASATFAGARHELTFTVEGAEAAEAAMAFVETLESAEFNLRGHILADIALVSQHSECAADGAALVRMAIEALTVESG